MDCWLDSFVIFQGIWNSIAMGPYSFEFFPEGGGGSGPPVPPLDPHMTDQTARMSAHVNLYLLLDSG